MASMAAPAAPVASEKASDVQSPTLGGGKSDLFARRKQRTRWVHLPEHDKPYLLVALRPIEVQDINTFCLETIKDPKDPKKEKRQFNSKRPFLLIARSLCESDGKPMFPPGNAGDLASLIYGGEQVANFLTYEETNILFDVVSELTGLGDKAAEEAEKNSETTGTGSS